MLASKKPRQACGFYIKGFAALLSVRIVKK